MRNDRRSFLNWGEAHPSQRTWDVSLRNASPHNVYQKCRKRLPCTKGFLSLPEQVAIKLIHLSPGMCYVVDGGVGSVFKCWEELGGRKPCFWSAILTCLYYFSWWIWLTWGFLLRALLSNTAMSWPGMTTPVDTSSHSWRHHRLCNAFCLRKAAPAPQQKGSHCTGWQCLSL